MFPRGIKSIVMILSIAWVDLEGGQRENPSKPWSPPLIKNMVITYCLRNWAAIGYSAGVAEFIAESRNKLKLKTVTLKVSDRNLEMTPSHSEKGPVHYSPCFSMLKNWKSTFLCQAEGITQMTRLKMFLLSLTSINCCLHKTNRVQIRNICTASRMALNKMPAISYVLHEVNRVGTSKQAYNTYLVYNSNSPNPLQAGP